MSDMGNRFSVSRDITEIDGVPFTWKLTVEIALRFAEDATPTRVDAMVARACDEEKAWMHQAVRNILDHAKAKV